MFVFKPVFKELIWGGHDILPFKGLPADGRKIGESWEISDVEGNKSILSENCCGEGDTAFEGKTIDKLTLEYGERLLGKSVIEKFGTVFPLLIKFIDARDDLSVQVHPNDDLAMKRHNSFGKTEMWYVVDAKPGAFLYSGFSCRITPEEYVKRVINNTITEVLQRFEVKTGDVFFLPAGRVHAIGAGCFIAEIQQTSNITYRIYDYDRKDANGNGRELHTELAKDAIDYRLYPDYKTDYAQKENKAVVLSTCKYFTVNILNVNKELLRDFSQLDSFVIYVCISGRSIIVDDKNNKTAIRQGETILVPAAANKIFIKPKRDCKLLEVFVEAVNRIC